MPYTGKHVLITGGASGFGLGMVREFAARNADVTVMDINDDLGRQVEDEIPSVTYVHCDVSSDHCVSAFFEESRPVDVLVNNAGITHRPGTLESITEDIFEQILAVNVKSVYLTSRYAVPVMKARDKGVILNIASTAGVSPRPGLTWYNASKGWMITATRSMAIELAPFGIRVNAINPVAGETPLLSTFLGEDTPEKRARFLSSIPLGRFSTPQDIASAACFLCSDEASMITGVTMEIDGGRCI